MPVRKQNEILIDMSKLSHFLLHHQAVVEMHMLSLQKKNAGSWFYYENQVFNDKAQKIKKQ